MKNYELLDADGKVTNTVLADESFMLQNHAEGSWREAAEQPLAVEPDPVEPDPVEPEWAWLMDTAPFTDRLGSAAAAIDLSTIPSLIAIRSDFARRKWIDLKDPRVVAAVRFLAGAAHPAFGTLASPLLTTEQAETALTTKPSTLENLALRKLYF